MTWTDVLRESARHFADQLAVLIPKAVAALAIIVLGWGLAAGAQWATVRLLQVLRADRLVEKARLNDMLRRGAIRLTFVELMGRAVYWFVIVASLLAALQVLGMPMASEWLARFGVFIPRLFAGLVLLLLGMLLASFLSAVVRAASLNAGVPQGHLLGQAVYLLVVLLTAIVALEQLQIVTRTIEATWYIVLGSCGLAFALAVGLGSKELVRQYLADLWERWKNTRP
ncbi:MAG: hypothetical protein HYY15_01765 [Candidatus Omnitrophica bacterium]|nr:hypothetical protein [Candidatus Omnitrophota bacterium]